MTKNPFGPSGDFTTSPNISRLFSEMVAIWVVSFWHTLGCPKKFNLIELGAGNGEMMKVMIESFKRFPSFFKSCNFIIHEKSPRLIKKQKANIKFRNVKWVKNLIILNNLPNIFLANEFFDAIPIKQFIKKKKFLFEKNYTLDQNYKIKEVFKKATNSNIKIIDSYKSFKNLRFIELPALGLKEMKKITKKISKLNGCMLMIDYGYLKPNNQNTLQSVMMHKKNGLLENLGKADITSHVNFSLLKEFFQKNDLKIKDIITQKEFLENMGILERAEIIAKKMKFREQSNLYSRLKRLLNPASMGNLFKVILAYNLNNNNFAGFK